MVNYSIGFLPYFQKLYFKMSLFTLSLYNLIGSPLVFVHCTLKKISIYPLKSLQCLVNLQHISLVSYVF